MCGFPIRLSLLLCLRFAAGQPQPQPRLELGFHTGTITSLAMDSAERFMVSSSDDGTVRVWDLPSIRQPGLRQLRVLRLPAGDASESQTAGAAITPDGKTIAAGGPQSRSIYIFDRETGRLLRRIAGLPHVILQLAYSPDGRYLAAVLSEGGGVRVYRASDYALAGEDSAYQGGAYCLAFSPAFAQDGLLATGAEDLYVRLYRVRPDGRAQLLRRQVPKQKEPPVGLAFSPDGRKLAVSLEYRNGYPEVEVWQPQTLTHLYDAIQLNAMGGVADNLAWSTGGQYVYFAGNLAAGSPTSLIVRVGRGGRGGDFETVRACGEQVQCYIAAILPLRDGSLIFASANQHGIGLLDTDWKVAQFHAAPIPVYGGLEDYDRFLISQDGTSLRFAYRQDGAEPAWFSVPQGSLVAGASAPGFSGTPPDDKSVDVRGLGTEEIRIKGEVLGLDGETGLRVAAVPNGSRFVVATLWSLFLFDGQNKRQWKIVLPASPEAIDVSGDGRFVAAALIDGTVRWFRLSDGGEMLALFPHPDRKRWILWTPGGYYDASDGAEEFFGFQTNHGEDRVPEFEPAAGLRAKYHRPDAVRKALQ